MAFVAFSIFRLSYELRSVYEEVQSKPLADRLLAHVYRSIHVSAKPIFWNRSVLPAPKVAH
jgi:hypothetical protein